MTEPEVFLLPDQFPDAVQLSASLLDQLSVVEPLVATVSGLAENDRVGTGEAGGATVTLTVSLVVPPVPVQIRV